MGTLKRSIEGKGCASIADLARQTGVSTGTISRVLNQRGRVAAETRRKVLAAARSANFRPRMSARRLTVAVVSDRIRRAAPGGYVSFLLSHMANELAGHDFAVELYTERNVDRLSDRFVDGVLAMAWDRTTVQTLHRLDQVPVVFMTRQDLPAFSVVGTDQREGACMVARYLLDRGHERIGILGEDTTWGMAQRVAGFREVFRERGLAYDESLIAYTGHQPAYSALQTMLDRKPTSIFIANEDLGLEASHVLTRLMGKRIGEDISVVAMENPHVSRFLDPPQTTLRQPLERMAEQAVQLLKKQIEAHKIEPTRVLLENELIERSSVVCLNA